MIEYRRVGLLDHVFYQAPDGAWYHVYDRRRRDGKWTAEVPPLRAAVSRVFVPASGPKRLYKFGPGEIHELTEAHLERQLRQAEYLHTSRFDAAARQPR
jgi:hypothetical protein